MGYGRRPVGRAFAAIFAAFAIAIEPATAGTASVIDAAGPSFSCTPATMSPVEQTICGDAKLAALDRSLASAYAYAFAASRDSLAVERDEAVWLHATRDRCASVSCLAQSYATRIASLELQARRDRHVPDDPLFNDRAVRVQLAPALLRDLERSAHDCFRDVVAYDAGDGRRSILAGTCHPGNDNGEIFLFHPDGGGSYRLILQALMNEGPERQTVRSHGLNRLRVYGHASAFEGGFTFYDYDGRRYRAVDCGDYTVDGVAVAGARYTPLTCPSG